jgi:hypothetical protein
VRFVLVDDQEVTRSAYRNALLAHVGAHAVGVVTLVAGAGLQLRSRRISNSSR